MGILMGFGPTKFLLIASLALPVYLNFPNTYGLKHTKMKDAYMPPEWVHDCWHVQRHQSNDQYISQILKIPQFPQIELICPSCYLPQIFLTFALRWEEFRGSVKEGVNIKVTNT